MVASAVAVPLLVAMIPSVSAIAADDTGNDSTSSTPTLEASWDFTGDYKSENGTIKDSTGRYDMTLYNSAYVEKFGDRSNNEALQLKGDAKQYAQISSDLFSGLGDSATIEFAAKSRQTDDGNYFSFAVGQDSSKYLMFYLSTTTAKLAIADNGWHNEPGFKTAISDNDNLWHTYRILIKDDSFALLRDGSLVGYKANTGIKLSDLGGSTTYIGRSFYDGDAYWNGAIDDIKVYKGAELNLPSAVSITGDGVVNGALSLVENNSSQLTATVTPSDAISTDVTWRSSDSSVATVDASGKVTAVKSGTATITATAKAGDAQAQLPVTVKPLDPQSAVESDIDSAVSAVSTVTTENLPLAATGSKYGSSIVWTSSNSKLITGTDAGYQAPDNGAADPYKGAGVVTRPAYGDGNSSPVTLTAVATLDGVSVKKTVKVVVKEKTRTAPNTGYAAVTFLSDSDTSGGKIGEALYESATSTTENNFFSFSQINNGDPVITSTTDTTGLRDPYVLKSHDGDKYYMIATDLKVSQQGWGQNQQYGSLKIEVWESTDMVNWTRTNAADGTDSGITVNSANQGMTWAPEAFWDDSLGAYVVFFSSRAYTDDTRSTAVTGANGGAYNIVRYAITRDFKTFTSAQDWQNTQYSRIDSSVFKIGGYYYRLTKNEESGSAGSYITTGKTTFLERSKCLTCTTSTADPNADESKTWRLLDQDILPFEGPESIALNPGDVNQNDAGDAMVIMADSGGYQPFMTSATALSQTSWSNRLSQTDGWFTQKTAGRNVTGYVYDEGMPSPKRHGAFVNVPQTVLEAMHSYTTQNKATVQAVDSSTELSFTKSSRALRATVKASDGGTVAGSVTFSSGAWSETARIDGDSAKVSVPADVEGVVTASYDGYTDGLVNGSSSSVTVEKAETNGGGSSASDDNAGAQEDATSTASLKKQESSRLPETGVSAAIIAFTALALAFVGYCIRRLSRER